MTTLRTSIAQVAERANVSPMTVSRVLKGRKSRFSPETYERVMAAVRELNYVPTRSSFQNRHVETNTIGYVPHNLDMPHNMIDSVTYEGMCLEARVHGYDLLTMLRDEADWMANREAVRFLDRRSDGFIFLSPRGGDWQEMLEVLIEQDVPVVVCYRRDVPQGASWVDPDNENIMRLAVRHLAEYGHERIALLTSAPGTSTTGQTVRAEVPSPDAHYDDLERQGHFRAAVQEFYGSPDCGQIVQIADKHLSPYNDSLEFLKGAGITAGICGDYLALSLWGLAERSGLRIPADFSLVGIDDQFPASHRGLTTVAFGYAQVGQSAIRAWVELKAGKPAADCSKVVPVQLIERDSVARPTTRR